MPRAPADGEVGEPAVLGLARARREHRGVAGVTSDLDNAASIAQRPHLIRLHEHRVGDATTDPPLEPLGRGDEQVVAEELNPVAEPARKQAPPFSIVLTERVLDRDDRVLVHPRCDLLDQLGSTERPPFARKPVTAFGNELRRSDVDGNRRLRPRLEPTALDACEQQVERGAVRGQWCGEPSLVGDERRRMPEPVELLGSRPPNPRRPLDRLRKARRADGHDEKVLDIDHTAGVGATRDDVDHREREQGRRRRG